MRFVFVISRLGRNGPSGTRIRLAEALIARGHEARILTFSATADRDVPAGVPVETVDRPVSGFPRGRWARLRLAGSLRRWMRAQAPLDVLSSSLTGTDRIVRLAGIENARHWLHIATSRLPEDAGSARGRARHRTLFRRLYDGARVIGVSRGVLDDLARLGARPRESDLVYNAFDVGRLRALAAEVPPDLPATPYVLHAGRFAPAKRYDLLFAAFEAAAIPHRLVLLTEPGPDLAALIGRSGLGDRVIVAGFRQNPYPFMAGAAALVLSSDREGFGNVLVESLIAGTPVIATDCPYGPAEILPGAYRRWLSPCGDAASLAANLQAVTTSPYVIEPWLYERFAIATAVDRLEEIAARGDRPTLGRRRFLE